MYKRQVQHCVKALFPNAGDVDRLQKAREHGCNVGSSPTLAGLVEILHQWGVSHSRARRTIEDYDRVVRQGNTSIALDAPVGRGGPPPVPLVDGEGPFYAMEVQPSYVSPSHVPTSLFLNSYSITFTYGGIAINDKGHALTADRSRIPGLLVAGVDAGGFSNVGYAGGLALAFVTGFWAAREVARQTDLPEPCLPAADVRDRQDKPLTGRL